MKDISLHLMDIAQNSITAGATDIFITLERKDGMMSATVQDNGSGMSKEFLLTAENPFTTTRTTRKIGLGIPLFRQNALSSGGSFSLESEEGVGTVIKAVFDQRNIDCIPVGDLGETMLSLVAGNPKLDFVFTLRSESGEYRMDTKEVRKVLGHDVPIDLPEVGMWIKEDLYKGINEIFGGAK